MKKIHSILVPSDLSPLSLAAATYARTLAKATNARLCLMHVVEIPVGLGDPSIDAVYASLMPEVEKVALKNLKKCAAKSLRGVRNVTVQLMIGNPYEEIIRLAKDKGFDLIVMATHGSTGLAHVLLGSVAEKVIRHSSVPVLLIKPKEILKGLTRPRAKMRRRGRR